MPTSQGMLSSEAAQQKNLMPVLICLALAILTLITFWSLKDCRFINLDDNVYVYENAYVQSGLNGKSIGQAFASSELMEKSGHWCPLTWLSLMLDYQIFGLNPTGYHLVNLLFHILNTILLFLILHRMTKTLWSSAFVACLFAIHPLHVESVAWITERKDVLSTFFWMLTMGAYSYYVENRGLRRYVLVLLFFVLGLMAKSMLVTLPFVLLLLDYWPLQRFQEIKPDLKVQTEEVNKPADPEYKWSLIYTPLWEKVPLFVLAILSSIVTYIAAQKVGAVQSIEASSLGVRIGNALISYITYIGKMIWPSNLAVFYPYPKLLVSWQVLGSVLLLIAITLVVIWRTKRFPYLVTGWLWYIGTLAPVIGIVRVGVLNMADRYTYIPLIGLFIIVAWCVPDLLKKWNYRKEILLALSALIILCLSIKTWTQVGYWQNSINLFNYALKVTKDNYLVHNNLGLVLFNEGKTEEAIYHYNMAIRIKTDFMLAYFNRGIANFKLGQYQRAIEDFNKAASIIPTYADTYYNKGVTYTYLGQHQLAIENYNAAIRLKPDYATAYNNRAFAYLNQGNKISGCSDAEKACAMGACLTLESAKVKGLCR